jgi:hypothetical protein
MHAQKSWASSKVLSYKFPWPGTYKAELGNAHTWFRANTKHYNEWKGQKLFYNPPILVVYVLARQEHLSLASWSENFSDVSSSGCLLLLHLREYCILPKWAVCKRYKFQKLTRIMLYTNSTEMFNICIDPQFTVWTYHKPNAVTTGLCQWKVYE